MRARTGSAWITEACVNFSCYADFWSQFLDFRYREYRWISNIPLLMTATALNMMRLTLMPAYVSYRYRCCQPIYQPPIYFRNFKYSLAGTMQNHFRHDHIIRWADEIYILLNRARWMIYLMIIIEAMFEYDKKMATFRLTGIIAMLRLSPASWAFPAHKIEEERLKAKYLPLQQRWLWFVLERRLSKPVTQLKRLLVFISLFMASFSNTWRKSRFSVKLTEKGIHTGPHSKQQISSRRCRVVRSYVTNIFTLLLCRTKGHLSFIKILHWDYTGPVAYHTQRYQLSGHDRLVNAA